MQSVVKLPYQVDHYLPCPQQLETVRIHNRHWRKCSQFNIDCNVNREWKVTCHLVLPCNMHPLKNVNLFGICR
jgi:hypothetical protein